MVSRRRHYGHIVDASIDAQRDDTIMGHPYLIDTHAHRRLRPLFAIARFNGDVIVALHEHKIEMGQKMVR